MPQLEGRGSARLRTQAMDRGGSIAPDQRAKGMYLDAQGSGGGEAAARSRTLLHAARALG